MLKDTPRDANPEMDCSPDDLLGWKDFPKGLRVLVLDEDNTSLAEVKSKLESMDYVVSAYHNNNEALMALSSENNGFHIALVEVSADNNYEAFKFLEKVKDVPIVMTSSINCLTVMMKCIALGAVEFLQKPLSEDKLRNIWQHVVHKAIRKNGSIHIKPMEDDSITWNADLESEDADGDKQNVSETDSTGQGYEQNFEQCGSDRLPEPATPTFKHGKSDQSFCTSENASPKQDCPIEIGKSKADYTYSDCSSVKENNEKVEKQVKRGEFNSRETESNSQRVDYHVQEELKTQEIEIKPENLCSSTTKSVENTCKYLDDENGCMEDVPSEFVEILIKDVDALTDREKDKCIISSNVQIVDNFVSNQPNGKRKRESIPPSPCNNRLSKKKLKIDWTPELHRRFVQAVEQLGVEQAIPSKILELMKVDGLTRHNVASHLQKYRMNRRLVLPKPEKHRWQYQRHTIHRGYTHKPIMAYPPFYPYCGISSNQVYSSWIQPGYHQSNAMQVWANQNFSQWACPTVHHNAWGSPAVSIQDPCVFSQTEEVIDRVIKEAINKPWLPLPLGLKPPSMESVLTELNRQGIRNISFRRS